MISIPNVEKLFQDKAMYPSPWKDGSYTIEVREIGLLNLGSGFIVACDPFSVIGGHKKPFSVQVEPGSYPIVLSNTHIEPYGYTTLAAMIQFSSEKPAKWEMALCAGEHIDSLSDDEILGYGVDSGHGSFMDIETYKLLAGRAAIEPHFDVELEKRIFHELIKTSPPNWANIVIDKATRLNVVLFGSGGGDGYYASYWGYAADGKIACLVTVFDDMEPSDEMESEDE